MQNKTIFINHQNRKRINGVKEIATNNIYDTNIFISIQYNLFPFRTYPNGFKQREMVLHNLIQIYKTRHTTLECLYLLKGPLDI